MLSFSLCIAANGPTLSGQPGQPAPRAPHQGQDDAASGMSRGNSDASSHTANGVSRGGGNMKAPYEPAVLYATAPAMSPQQPTAAQAYTPLPEKVTRCPRLAVKGSTHDPDTSIGTQQHCGGQQRQAAQKGCHRAARNGPDTRLSLILLAIVLWLFSLPCSACLLLCRSRARALQHKSPQDWMTSLTWG